MNIITFLRGIILKVKENHYTKIETEALIDKKIKNQILGEVDGTIVESKLYLCTIYMDNGPIGQEVILSFYTSKKYDFNSFDELCDFFMQSSSSSFHMAPILQYCYPGEGSAVSPLKYHFTTNTKGEKCLKIYYFIFVDGYIAGELVAMQIPSYHSMEFRADGPEGEYKFDVIYKEM